MLTEEVNDTSASLVVAQLLYLEGRIHQRTSAFILTALAVPSRRVASIYDAMQYIKCDVSTICMGMAASTEPF